MISWLQTIKYLETQRFSCNATQYLAIQSIQWDTMEYNTISNTNNTLSWTQTIQYFVTQRFPYNTIQHRATQPQHSLEFKAINLIFWQQKKGLYVVTLAEDLFGFLVKTSLGVFMSLSLENNLLQWHPSHLSWHEINGYCSLWNQTNEKKTEEKIQRIYGLQNVHAHVHSTRFSA